MTGADDVAGWADHQLTAIGDASEIAIVTSTSDGRERAPLPIWVVRVGAALYVRSYNGPDGSWYRQVRRRPEARVRAAGADHRVRLVPVDGPAAEVDAAYRAKYGSGGYGAAMTRPAAAATTLRVDPA